MDEHAYLAPAADATGRPTMPPPPASGRRRDLPPPPAGARRADLSQFAPPPEFSRTAPLDPPVRPGPPEGYAYMEAPVHEIPPVATPRAIYDEPLAPVDMSGVYDLPAPVAPPAPPVWADAPAPAPASIVIPEPRWDPVDEQPAVQVYDLLSGEAIPPQRPAAPTVAEQPEPPVQQAPVAASFPAPKSQAAYDPEALAAVDEHDLSGDLLGALREVLFRGASDLHISAGAPPMLRIDGALGPIGDGKPWSRETVRATLLDLLSPYERERFESTLELDFAYTLTANARFRVNYYQDRGAMSAAFRIIPNEVKQLAQLGIPDPVASFATLPRGLVLVTGTTGSGKSTTLAALIDIVN